MSRLVFLLVIAVAIMMISSASAAAKKKKEKDPRECEVCVANLNKIDSFIPDDKKTDTDAIEKAIGKHCTLSGFGSEWKPNPALESQRDVKMCYIFEPIKRAISTPMATRMPKEKVCRRLEKENPDICNIKYPLKVEKTEGEKTDYSKLKIKELKEILRQRNVDCKGCTEKTDYVKRCEATEDGEL